MDNTPWLLALPAIVLLAGGLLTAVWNPGPGLISLVQHVAAGIILAAVTVEVFPAMRASTIAPHWLVAVFTVGVIFMFGVKQLGERLEAAGASAATARRWNWGLIITVFLDAALDGVTIGAGFAAGEKVGLSLAIGLAVEMLFLGMSLVSDTLHGRRLVWLSAGLSLTILTTAVAGYYVLRSMPAGTVALALAFSAAALLYLVTEELLIEAHARPEGPWSMLLLFGGFVAFWIVSLL